MSPEADGGSLSAVESVQSFSKTPSFEPPPLFAGVLWGFDGLGGLLLRRLEDGLSGADPLAD